MQKIVVLNVVGLTPSLLAEMPFLSQWSARGKIAAVKPILPGVTCSVQATYLTGKFPDGHGIVANGWLFRDELEVKFWRQSNRLVQSPKIWELAKSIDPTFTCANLFWWYNMHSSVDYAITPRPMYPADGRKIPDIYTKPAAIRTAIQAELGQFPLFEFWGPNTSARSSQWIADSAKWTEQRYSPTLTLIYLPHLDYCLQRFGPKLKSVKNDLQDIDRICGELINFYEERGAAIAVLSEYGITEVSRPVHLNRVLRESGLLAVREELGRELLDPGASIAFAVADHQLAHVYVNDPAYLDKVQSLLMAVEGVADVLDRVGKQRYHLDHPRAGELVAIAAPDAWFTYYYWLDDRCAPDFARTVDIHRKPGYDPVELFIDPELPLPKLKVALTLLKKQLGFRYLMEVISLDASLVRGSHGCLPAVPEVGPLLIAQQGLDREEIGATEVCNFILQQIFSQAFLDKLEARTSLCV